MGVLGANEIGSVTLPEEDRLEESPSLAIAPVLAEQIHRIAISRQVVWLNETIMIMTHS